MSLRAYEFFATPLIIAPLEGGKGLVERLAKTVMTRRQSDAAAAEISSEEDLAMPASARSAVAELVEAATALADQFVVDIDRRTGEKRFRWHAGLRADFAGSVALSAPPFFPGAYWSFLTVIGLSGRGEVRFEDPRMPMINMEEPRLNACLAPDGARIANEYRRHLLPVELMMCPAWLRRTVSLDGEDTALLTLNLTAYLATPPQESGRINREGTIRSA